MPTTAQQSSLELSNPVTVPKLGIIAGGGDLPGRLIHACDQAGQPVFIVGFEGQTDASILEGRNFMMTRLGAAGQILETLRTHDIHDLVLIGSIRRPTLTELKPDLRTAQFFATIALKSLGDDGLLKVLRSELEKEGFVIHGVHRFVTDLLAPQEVIGKHKPKKADWPDIQRGIIASQQLGLLDIGQSVVVQEGILLGVEGVEGTDELIKRCGAYRRGGRGPILVKTCKPQQDHDFDLPAVGPETVRKCAAVGMSGIVLHAGHSLLIDRKKVAALADEHKLFVVGVDLEAVTNNAA
ncbi:MAG: UDP-2,3-diacylglucosamine diphosphatase LpxI [Rhodospirillales bacterium]|nr:UDP-2,3-diacylglucosamine diphosphatase LpxI [Rhodospirillales bacterium]MCB9995625.1 UDP-2,3-diacylglucosamine diphosphatase LpxI [Rhodospirillales bacterium]